MFENTNNTKTDTLQRKFIKYILGVSKSSPNIAIYGDTGEVPLSIKGYRLVVNYWKRLNSLPDTNLAKIALMENIDLRTNWIMTIEKLLKTFNLIETTSNDIQFKRESKQNSTNYYKAHWYTTLESGNSSRLLFYQKINNDFTPAKYINLPVFNTRKAIAKIRCSDHCLEIEKGRHRNTPRDVRLCKMCSDMAIEDEGHFLLKCKKYEHLRKEHHINTDNVTQLMNVENQESLAQYLISAFELRQATFEYINKQ